MEKHGRNEGRLGQGQSLLLLVVLVSLAFLPRQFVACAVLSECLE